MIAMMPLAKVLRPSEDAHLLAGLMAGTLNRTQNLAQTAFSCRACGHANSVPELGREMLRKLLNDALIYVTALENGCAVLTGNGNEFDLLAQLLPGVTVITFSQPSGMFTKQSLVVFETAHPLWDRRGPSGDRPPRVGGR